MGSTRLPGKVLFPIDGVPALKYQIDRVRKCNTISKIVVATTELAQDDAIADFCDYNKLSCFRGSENDVINRYFLAARSFKASVIVRLTADCPFSDAAIIDEAVRTLLKGSYDYVSNTVPPEHSTFPDGSDVEVFTFEALQRAVNMNLSENEKEHVTFCFWGEKASKTFKSNQMRRSQDDSAFRFTIDYQEDYDLALQISKKIKDSGEYGSVDFIINVLRDNPKMAEINSQFSFGDGWKNHE